MPLTDPPHPTKNTPVNPSNINADAAKATAVFYEKKATVGYSDIDYKGNLKIVAIMNFLQNAASEHASIIGASGFDLAMKDLGWVIHRYHLQIDGRPYWQAPIAIKTFRFPHKQLYDLRNLSICLDKERSVSPPIQAHDTTSGRITSQTHFQATDAYSIGTDRLDTPRLPFVQAKVCWVMVSRKNGRPVRLSKFMSDDMCRQLSHSELMSQCKAIDFTPFEGDNANSDDAGYGGCDPSDDASIQTDKVHYQFPEIKIPERIDLQLPFKVRMHDLDLNGHVNNAIFVEWAVETVPEEILSQYTPSTIDVQFQKESLYGDVILSKTQVIQKSGVTTRHQIIRKQDQAELAGLNIRWRKEESLQAKRGPASQRNSSGSGAQCEAEA